jgi:hypothetical protein
MLLLLGPEFSVLDTSFFSHSTWHALRRRKWIVEIVLGDQRHVRLTDEALAYRDRYMIQQCELLNRRMYDGFGRKREKSHANKTTVPIAFDASFIRRASRKHK